MAAQFELTREFIDNLKQAVINNDEKAVHDLIKDMHAADIAELYGGLTIEEAKLAKKHYCNKFVIGII